MWILYISKETSSTNQFSNEDESTNDQLSTERTIAWKVDLFLKNWKISQIFLYATDSTSDEQEKNNFEKYLMRTLRLKRFLKYMFYMINPTNYCRIRLLIIGVMVFNIHILVIL